MGEIIYDKLVRDKIPEIIKDDGNIPIVETLNDEEYRGFLVKKLFEECGEFAKDRNIGELADIMEVVDALAVSLSSSMEAVVKVKKEKREKRGGFEKRIKLVKVIEGD
jgi:predicted house-cleaning noncanonical NTP pyrophosphatase (MazG superfamily)